MYSFFVLGQIPGTSITISFTMWLTLCLAATLIYLAVRMHRNQPLQLGMDPTIGSDDHAATAQ
ncbi:MAG: hypothetical protein JWN82_77 [Candidatus Saccharibacteria bacterium]|nr:hypothetical protein [Candidatus Saccharibacteria bacterium]